ncbi:unnamed protein product [Amoebophrya sp. A25]|nr:unnamed protein product [Amoebophrya sp. A25]|eukprot:GSA25T00021549001.1
MPCCGPKSKRLVEELPTLPPSIRSSGDVELDMDVHAAASEEQERDFVRIFRASKPSLFVLNRDAFQQLSAANDRAGETTGHDVSGGVRATVASGVSVTERDVDDEVEHFLGQLRDQDPEGILRPFTDEELRRFVIKHISVEQSFQFCVREGLAPLYLQPKYLVLLSEKEGIVIVTYGFVAEAAKCQTQVVGDRPDRKCTPWIARLELRSSTTEVSDHKTLNSRVLSHSICPARQMVDTRAFIDADVRTLRAKYFPT